MDDPTLKCRRITPGPTNQPPCHSIAGTSVMAFRFSSRRSWIGSGRRLGRNSNRPPASFFDILFSYSLGTEVVFKYSFYASLAFITNLALGRGRTHQETGGGQG